MDEQLVTTPQTSDGSDGRECVDLNRGCEHPNIGTIATGTVTGLGRYLRARIDVNQDESVALAVRAVGRAG